MENDDEQSGWDPGRGHRELIKRMSGIWPEEKLAIFVEGLKQIEEGKLQLGPVERLLLGLDVADNDRDEAEKSEGKAQSEPD